MNAGPSTSLSGFVGKPDGKASQLLWDSLRLQISTMPKLNSKVKSPMGSKNRTTKISKLSKSPQKNTLISSGWMSKKKYDKTTPTPSSTVQQSKESVEENLKDKYCKKTKKKKKNNNTTSVAQNKADKKTSVTAENNKKSTKPKTQFERTDSGGSLSEVGLPTFKLTKPKKSPKKSKKDNEGFQKYGILLPTLDEIITERKNYEVYKMQVESAKTLEEPDVSMSFSPFKNKNRFEEDWLDCKHLSNNKIEKYFKSNITYLEDIRNGQKFSERHQRYQDRKNQVANIMTTKDLTYNTSMIVFTFEQIDHMIKLLRDHFDPEDMMSDYFFKVLIPELCLKIFMDCHNMSEMEAIAYLDDRPVE